MRSLLLLCGLLAALGATTLDELIQHAITDSPILQAKKLATKMQHAAKEAVKAKSYGKVDLSASYTHYNVPRTLKPLTPPITPDITTSKNITSLGARYSVALFRGFADLAQIEVSKLSAKRSEIDYKLTKNELIYNIKALYFKALGLQAVLEALKAHEKALQRLYETTQKSLELGKVAQLDLLKVKSALIATHSKVVTTTNTIESIKAHLKALTGLEVDRFTPAKEETIQKQNTPYIIQKAMIETKKSQKELKKAKALYLPKLLLDATYAKNFAKGEDEEVWQSSLVLAYDLFDFGYKKHSYQKAKIATLIAQKNLAAKRRDLESRITETHHQIDSLHHQLEALRQNLTLLAKIESIEKIKYQSGRSTIDDYLQALANAKQAAGDLESTRYELYTKEAYLNYLKAGE